MLNTIKVNLLKQKLNKITKNYFEKADFEQIYKEFKDQDFQTSKFVDKKHQIHRNAYYINRLNLNSENCMSILDIGCGAGWFLFFCKMLGHKVHGLDVDDNEMYNRMITMFGIDRTIFKIQPFKPLPKIHKKFDLITAFLITFNGRKKGNYWDKDEFNFFLKDLASNYCFKYDSQIFLQFNSQYGKPNICYSNEVESYFKNKGAEVQGSIVHFKDVSKLL